MAYENLPGIYGQKIDGNLAIAAVNDNPVVLIIGTATRGDAEKLYTVNSASTAASVFGRSDGTLIRGMYEALAGGAENLRLMRIGAKSAKLTGVGTGVTIETISKDAGAGDQYKLFFDDATDRIRIWRTSDDLLVYDNYPSYPSAAVDLNEVSVSGTVSGSAGNIGTLAAPLTLYQSNGVSGATYTAGNDGVLLSRMELFEALFVAYNLLENEDVDFVVPQNVYLDDSNVCDMTTAEVSAFNVSAPWAAASVYPTPGTFYDGLGKVFAQEYLGTWYFWWDMDNDGQAEIYPTAGSSSATTDAFGVTLEAGDFHEANFAYQLANFCYTNSQNNQEVLGTIGVLPPISWSLKDVSAWIGRSPTYTDDSAGNSIVTTNGTGLLGNKWMAGRMAESGRPALTINNLAGLAEGGFIATDDGWPDGAQEKDRNDHLIDIGKYISVVGAQGILANGTSSTAYAATVATVYAGFVASLSASSAPTNKVQPGVRLPFRVGNSKLDALAGARYVMLRQKPKGIVISDAPTATRSDSDYKRLTTIRIVKACIDGVRAVGEPFLGEGITNAQLAALETAIQGVLLKLQKLGYLQRFDYQVSATPAQRVQGQADVELVLVPAFELRQITVNVALAAE